MEQVLTDEQLILLLDVLEEGDKSFTQASYRDLIMTAHTDMLFELGIRDVVTMEAGWKAFGGLQTKFHGKILSIYGKFQAGTLSTAAATTQFNNMLKAYGKDAFMAGTEMVGNSYYKEVGMTAKDKAFISKYARTETRHWRKFLNDVKDPKHLPANKIPKDASGRLLKGYRRQVHPYRQRVGYYADSLRGMGFNGMVAGAGTLLNIFWVLDKLVGRRTDHCNDCVRISAGNPYSWQTLPTTPRAGDTECKYRCYCGLEFQQRKGRGKEFDIPGSGSVQGLQAPNRWARIFDRFGRPISGAPLQDIEDIYQRMYKARQMIEITKAQEKLSWIRARQQLNNVLINQYPQYRKIPLVSVKDLTKAITAARPARGDLLKSLANVSSGTEVTFLRGNYFANGKLFLERGQWVFKDATGVNLAANLETDIIFSLTPKWRPSGTLAQAQRWALEKRLANIVDYSRLSIDQANTINQLLVEMKGRFKNLGTLEFVKSEVGLKGKYMMVENGGLVVGKDVVKHFSVKAAKANLTFLEAELADLRMQLGGRIPSKTMKLYWDLDKRIKNVSKLVKSLESGKFDVYTEHSAYAFKNRFGGIVRHEIGHWIHDQNLLFIDSRFASVLGPGDKWRKLYSITQRARDSWSECIAENFTLYSTGKTGRMHKDMIKLFDDLLR